MSTKTRGSLGPQYKPSHQPCVHSPASVRPEGASLSYQSGPLLSSLALRSPSELPPSSLRLPSSQLTSLLAPSSSSSESTSKSLSSCLQRDSSCPAGDRMQDTPAGRLPSSA